jgi:hypothetical protein
MLIPWAVFWGLFHTTTNPWLSTALPFLLMLLMVIHLTPHHQPGILEIGSLGFLGLSVILAFGRVPWFLRWGSVIGGAFQGILWLSALWEPGPSYPAKNAEKTARDQGYSASAIIHLMWGYQFLLATNLGMLAEFLTQISAALTIFRFALLGPGLLLTWIIKERSNIPQSSHPQKANRQVKTAAAFGIVLNAALIIQMIWMG